MESAGGAGIRVRIAVSGEADRIASVLSAAFEEFRPMYTREAFDATTPSADRIRNRWEEGPVWVADWNSIVLGTVSAVPRGEDLYIRSMAVLPAFKGRGIGKLLLQNVEKYASRGNFRRLILSTTPFLLDAIRLYEGFGFVRSPEGPDDLFGTPLFTLTKEMKCDSAP